MVGRAACDAAARGEDIVVLLAEELGGRATLDELGMRRLLTVPPRPHVPAHVPTHVPRPTSPTSRTTSPTSPRHQRS